MTENQGNKDQLKESSRKIAYKNKLKKIEKNYDLSWRILSRLDSYTISVNSKAGLMIAYNTFVIGGVFLKIQDSSLCISGFNKLTYFTTGICLLFILASSTASLFYIFWSIKPFLESPSDIKKYYSVIFFGHINSQKTEDDYLFSIKSITKEAIQKDLAFQIFAISKGLKEKFNSLKLSIIIILLVHLPSFLALMVVWAHVYFYHFFYE